MTLEAALTGAVGSLAVAVGALWVELRRVQASRAKERAAEAERYERLVRDVLGHDGGQP